MSTTEPVPEFESAAQPVPESTAKPADPKKIIYPPAGPAAPREFTAILVGPDHKDYSTIRARHAPQYQGNTTLNIVALAWINSILRLNQTPLTPQMIGQSIVSIENSDGTLTPVTTVVGPGQTTTADAPLEKGEFQYVVQHVDTAGLIGPPVHALAKLNLDSAWSNSSNKAQSDKAAADADKKEQADIDYAENKGAA